MAGERIEGLSIGLDLDYLSVDAGLKDLNRKMSLVNSEMKANLTAFDKGDKSIQRYNTVLDGLNKKLEVQKARTESARQTYEKMVKQHGEGSQEAEKAAIAYNKEQASLKNLEKSIEGVSKEMRASQSVLLKFGDQLTNISEKANNAGDILTKTVTPALVGVAAAALLVSNNFSGAVGSIQANLGATEEEALHLAGVANDVFKDGWGESLDYVTESLLTVKEQLSSLTDDELTYATKQAIALENALGLDQGETLRGVNALMKTYGMTVEQAFDYMVKGAQNGLNKTDELGDNLAEYATLFEESGYSASDMFSILEAGLDGGAYNLDKVNDLVKEFGIRVNDGTIKDAMEGMASDWQEIYRGWEEAGGTNAELFTSMAKHLKSLEDPQRKQAALIEIWGTMGEDAGYKVIEAMAEVGDTYDDVNGSAQKVVDTIEATQQMQFAQLWRELLDQLVPVGDILLEMGNEALPILKDAVESLTETWTGLTDEQQETVVQVGLMIAAGGPALKLFAGLTGGAGKFAKGLFDVVDKLTGNKGVKGALDTMPSSASSAGGAAALFTNPWLIGAGAIIAAVGGIGYVIYKEATSHEQDHNDSIDNTQGKYEDWFTAVTDGAIDVAEAQRKIQDSTNVTGESYEEMTLRIKKQNQDVTDTLSKFWGGKEFLADMSFWEKLTNYDNWRELHEEAMNGISVQLSKLSGVTDKELESMQAGYVNYGTMIGNTMADVINTFANGEAVTFEYANANIEAMNMTKEEVVAALTAQRDAEQERLDQMKENLGDKYTLYEEESKANQDYYNQLIEQTNSSTKNINDILTTAANEQRALTQEEVIILLGEYERLASGSGKSLSNLKEAQDLLADNMTTMVSEIGLSALTQTGIISEETAKQISALNSQEGKVAALKNAFDVYNNTGVPAKNIYVTTNAFGVVIEVNKALASIRDKTIHINAIETWSSNRVSSGSALIPGRATGDDYFSGGLAFLGDGGRPEPFLEPSGRFGISPATDTLFNLEKGTKIWPSIQAFKAEMPHFAMGSSGSTEVQRLIANYGRGDNLSDNRIVSDNSKSIVEGDTYNIHLHAYGDIPTPQIKKMAQEYSVEIARLNEKAKRRKGVVTHGPR